jgi:DNA-directed RNA polymerase specialized sigma24 family protein
MWQAVFACAGDPEVASDAVAEAFTQACRRGDAIRSPERWLWRTVFKIAAEELKARRHVGSARARRRREDRGVHENELPVSIAGSSIAERTEP